jgi:nitroimidazol reductase NimA-like FMN-containing flavoprotein (pyridoxamine 5'-phosphate oxidase superfamily)
VTEVPLERRGGFLVKMYALDAEACIDLLERCRFGRVGFVDGSEGVSVLPVNCLYSGGVVLFRTAAGSALDRLRDGGPVSFETDDIDPDTQSGWSVLVRGRASLVTDQQRLASLGDTEVHPWAPGHRDLWIEIVPDRITGRMIRRQRHQGRGDHLPAMPPD